MYAVHRMCCKLHDRSLEDWNVGRKIVRYLQGAKSIKLVMKPIPSARELTLKSYSDADWVGDQVLETKYVSMTEVCREVMDLKETIIKMNISLKIPIEIMCNNQAAIHQACGESSPSRGKAHRHKIQIYTRASYQAT